MRNHTRKNQDGMALLLATLFITVALVTLTVLTTRMINQKRQVDLYGDFEADMYGIESAFAQSKASLESGGNGMIGVTSAAFQLEWNELPTFDSPGIEPLEVPGLPEVEYFACDIDWQDDGVDNNGDGMIDDVSEMWFHTIYAFARNNNIVRTAEAVLKGANVSVWNNAIFAGAGHVDGSIKGNCSIHGSVHILGDHVPEGGEAIVVLDMMGASLIHNNYGIGAGPGPALPDYLRDRVPDQPLTIVNGEIDQATLNTVLRVKNGLVSLNSASEVGAADVFGNGLKDTVDGTFSNDGWTGQRVADDGDRGDPSVVFSDNGWDEFYDLGNKVPFPVLDDDWRWPAQVQCHELGYAWEGEPGSIEAAPDGTDYLHGDFFSDMLSDGNPYEGNVTISVGTDFYLNLTQPGSAPADRVKPDPANCIKGDDYIYYDAAATVMEINGQIEINGDLVFSARNDRTLNYTGRAAILVHGDVTVNTNLLSCNDGDPNDYLRSFPERNIIGIMAEQDMLVGQSAQLDLMGAFYAQGQISSNKQTVVMGTFVAEYFDMGNQVPDIYQVPALTENLPLGMIANYPILVFSPISWREL
ncbi:MAG: hypothetical protein GWP08_12830 [Nitrospiraceae bacterium]|nr:hypothetical protein [Nitrospiraceae bacterium]